MDKKIIIINGSGSVGKDKFVEFIAKYIDTETYSSIDTVKRIATQFGWNGVKDEKGRKFLRDIKNAWVEYNDGPFRETKQVILDFIQISSAELLFIMIREPEEIKKIVNEFDVITLLIKNDRVSQIRSNCGDANVFNYKYDHVIENNGTLEDLEKSANSFLTKIFRDG